MVDIRRIRTDEINTAKHLILTVAYNIFGFSGSLEESIHHFETSGELNDMNNLHSNYFEAGGTFLVVIDNQQVVGTGALRRLDSETAELKRMWLQEEFHGQGIGYRLILQLIEFARQIGYKRIRLQTSPKQVQALRFYRKVGFHEIPCYNQDFNEISMEMKIT